MSSPKVSVIIVAGGKGSRMQSDVPKQFMELSGKPVLMHTLLTFSKSLPAASIIVVLPSAHLEHWDELCRIFSFDIPHQVTSGGVTRYHSVKNGLALISNDTEIVAIHDAVRPFVAEEVILNAIQTASESGTAIPVTTIKDSLRLINAHTTTSINRENLRAVQTPQCFKMGIISNAYNIPYAETFTDDASVVEALGVELTLIPGNEENFKITTGFDFFVAERLLEHNNMFNK